MDIVFSHSTALRMLREFATYRDFPAEPCRAQGLPRSSRQVAAAADSLLKGPEFEDETHILVGDPRARIDSRHLKCHVMTSQLPTGACLKLSYGAYLSSPELCLMQMASSLTFAQLVALGCELCGTYVLNKHSDKGFDNTAAPLTTVGRIERLARRMPGATGSRQVLDAAKHILEGSNSPAETILSERLCLSAKHGGRRFEAPLLNCKLHLSDTVSRRVGRSYCMPDLFYPDASLVIEYYGKNYHSKDYQFFRDAERSNLLGYLGLKLITVTSVQLMYDAHFEELVRDICKGLGRRYRRPTERQLEKQRELREQIQADWTRRELLAEYERRYQKGSV